jgi:hypothetical protein
VGNFRTQSTPLCLDAGRDSILRTGSLTPLLRFRHEILEPLPGPATDPEALNAFRQIWQGALEIGRKGEVEKTAEARAEVEALSREAERLENECDLRPSRAWAEKFPLGGLESQFTTLAADPVALRVITAFIIHDRAHLTP